MACDLNRWPVGLIGIVSGFAIRRGLGTVQKHTPSFTSCLLTRKQRNFCNFISPSPSREGGREMKTRARRERSGGVS